MSNGRLRLLRAAEYAHGQRCTQPQRLAVTQGQALEIRRCGKPADLSPEVLGVRFRAGFVGLDIT